MTKARLYQPNLNCAYCYKLYQEVKEEPACAKNLCPIVDIATSYSLHEKVNAFLQVESFDMTPAYADVARKILRDSGLGDESPDTILEMRAALVEYREWKAKTSGKRK
ncbi:MAG: hypothetical protein E6R03_09700 [Hyphomicrobiaceae bacterium]|nr:MAG: hypothetical protein E6R03_09700 [Hyphomicrobiaceae bacterium]